MAHILIADDDEPIRSTLRMLLEDQGRHHIIEAADGVEALALIRASEAPLIVILDLMMPRLSGAGVLQAIASDARLAARDAYIIYTPSWRQWDGLVPDNMTPRVDMMLGYFDIEAFLARVAHAEHLVRRPNNALARLLDQLPDSLFDNL